MKFGFSLILLLVAGLLSAAECESLFEKRCGLLRACTADEVMDHIISDNEVREIKKTFAKEFSEKSLVEMDKGSVDSNLSGEMITSLFDAVARHPVADLRHYSKYDPSNRGIGFCFGRAMTAHLEALWKFKVPNQNIRKIWALGSLKSGGTNWRYHVTTVVKAKNGEWWAIDPIFGRPMKAEVWHESMRSQYDSDGTMMVFQSPAKRFGPSQGSQAYSSEVLYESDYNDYFVDLLNVYRKEFKRKGGED